MVYPSALELGSSGITKDRAALRPHAELICHVSINNIHGVDQDRVLGFDLPQ